MWVCVCMCLYSVWVRYVCMRVWLCMCMMNRKNTRTYYMHATFVHVRLVHRVHIHRIMHTCMFICVHMRVCVGGHFATCVQVYMPPTYLLCVNVHAVCMYVCMYVRTYVCMCVYVCVCVCVHLCACLCTCICMCVHAITHIDTYTHTRAHIHTYIHMPNIKICHQKNPQKYVALRLCTVWHKPKEVFYLLTDVHHAPSRREI